MAENNFTIIETFVGAGGSHLGFKNNNFETIFVNDIWKESLKTLKFISKYSLLFQNKIIF